MNQAEILAGRGAGIPEELMTRSSTGDKASVAWRIRRMRDCSKIVPRPSACHSGRVGVGCQVTYPRVITQRAPGVD